MNRYERRRHGYYGTPRAASAPTPKSPVPADLLAWLEQQTWSDFAQDLARKGAKWGLSARQMAAAESMRTKCQAREQARNDRTIPEPEPGFYYAEGRWHHVVRNRTKTRVYAKTWNEATEVWDYTNRAPFAECIPANRLTADQAAAFGFAFGRCINCSATLTDPESVARGIGPVCYKRLFPEG